MTSRRPPRPGRRAARRRAAGAGALAVCLAAAGGASGQTITGSISETILGDTNLQLEDGDEGTLGSITRLNLNVFDSTPTSSLSIGAGFNYSAYSSADNDNISGLFPTISAGYAVRRPTRSLNFGLTTSLQPVDFTTNTGLILNDPTPDPTPPDIEDPDDLDPDDLDPDDPGIDPDAPPDGGEIPGIDDPGDVSTQTSRETLRLRVGASAGFSQTINPQESVSFGVNGSRLDFLDNDGSLTPSTTFGANAGWNRRLTNQAGAGLTGSVTYFESDGDDNRRTVSFGLVPRISYAVTPTERYSFSLGPAISFTSFDEAQPGGGRRSVDEVGFSLRGSAGFSYVDGPNAFNATLNQSAQPADEGELVNRTSLRVGASRRISATSNVNASAFATLQSALFGSTGSDFEDTLFMGVNAGYGHQIDDRSSVGLNWFAFLDEDNFDEVNTGVGANYSVVIAPLTTANLGYDVRWETEPDSLVSHRVLLTLSRAFTLLP